MAIETRRVEWSGVFRRHSSWGYAGASAFMVDKMLVFRNSARQMHVSSIFVSLLLLDGGGLGLTR